MMANCKRLCVGIVGFALLGMLIVGALGTSWAQQPLSVPALPEMPPSLELPKPASPQNPSEDFKSDPLFREIQRIVLQGKEPAPSNSFVGSTVPKDSQIDSLGNDRWHAIESILAGARLLENDVTACIRQNDLEGAAKLQSAIKNLRMQAVELLHGK